MCACTYGHALHVAAAMLRRSTYIMLASTRARCVCMLSALGSPSACCTSGTGRMCVRPAAMGSGCLSSWTAGKA